MADRMQRRAHSPIPPPREPRRDPDRPFPDRRPIPPHYRGEGRRQRSRSPPDRFGRGRSPPPPFKRGGYRAGRDDDPYSPRYESPHAHRGGYDDEYYGGEPYRGGGDYGDHVYPPIGMEPPPPPPGRPPSQRNRPLTFKEFMLHEVADDVAPAEAQEHYQAYLVSFYGSRAKAEFEASRKDPTVRARFDPRGAEELLQQRLEGATTAAAALAAELVASPAGSGGVLDPEAPSFNQGTGESPGEGWVETPRSAAPQLWTARRVAKDLGLARRLMVVLDHEKQLEVGLNPLLPQPASAAAEERQADASMGEGDGGDGGSAAEVAEPLSEGRHVASSGGDPGASRENGTTSGAEAATAAAVAVAGEAADGPEAAYAAQLQQVEKEAVALEEELPNGGPGALATALGRLDLALTWLWRVHGVDYYGGRELEGQDYEERLSKSRTLRGPAPEEGEEQEEEEAKADATKLAQTVDEPWAARIKGGDPLLARCQRDKIKAHVEEWVESQIVQHAKDRWGSHLSNKLFMEKRFVVKHIHGKHSAAMDAERDKYCDELAFQAFKEDYDKRLKEQDDAHAAQGGDGAEHQEGDEWGGGAWDGARARGRGGRGRGGRGPMLGPGRRGSGGMAGFVDGSGGGPMMALDPTAAAAMMATAMSGGAPMGPIFIPIAGTGPMGAPVLGPPQPLAMAGSMPLMAAAGSMDMDALMGGGGRGGGRGPRGRGGARGRGHGGGGGLNEYYDLDNPRNNRMVLDYTDL